MLIARLFIVWLVLALGVAQAKVIKPHIKSRAELEYGTVLYAFYQQDYFASLIEDGMVLELNNSLAKSERGQINRGGMMLSYGLADESEKLFRTLLSNQLDERKRNRIWYYLARFYYNKSKYDDAFVAIKRIKGEIPADLNFDYHYLATLIQNKGRRVFSEGDALNKDLINNPLFPYLQFNLAITQLRTGKVAEAVNKLEQVAAYSGSKEEFLVIADRAKHALSQVAIRNGRFDQAWVYLTGIRTTGLYSNRALLSYAWTAIKLKRHPDAIAALKLLNERSIASPEVQEAKVLLAHLYEQEGSPRKALKANLLSIKDFKTGKDMVNEARRIIDKKDVPREFITNIEAIMDDSDWHSAKPSVDYKNLTPFLIDLMASNPFHETLKELADLYSLRKNLNYWLKQADEHLLILESAEKMKMDQATKNMLQKSKNLHKALAEEKSELSLLNMTLTEKDQERMGTLFDVLSNELLALDEKIALLNDIKSPYKQPVSYKKEVKRLHDQINVLLDRTQHKVSNLEPVMRGMVKAELDKHEERMTYYWAQSRLAKARLYDTTLSTLEEAQRARQQEEKPND